MPRLLPGRRRRPPSGVRLSLLRAPLGAAVPRTSGPPVGPRGRSARTRAGRADPGVGVPRYGRPHRHPRPTPPDPDARSGHKMLWSWPSPAPSGHKMCRGLHHRNYAGVNGRGEVFAPPPGRPHGVDGETARTSRSGALGRSAGASTPGPHPICGSPHRSRPVASHGPTERQPPSDRSHRTPSTRRTLGKVACGMEGVQPCELPVDDRWPTGGFVHRRSWSGADRPGFAGRSSGDRRVGPAPPEGRYPSAAASLPGSARWAPAPRDGPVIERTGAP